MRRSCNIGSVENANSLAHSPWGNIARTRMNSGVEQKQGRLVLFGHSYLQHTPPGRRRESSSLQLRVSVYTKEEVVHERRRAFVLKTAARALLAGRIMAELRKLY